MQYTGERIIPKTNQGNVEEHARYYQEGIPYVYRRFVLDIACGVGWGTKLMANAAQYIIGVDIDPETIEYAKKHYYQSDLNYTFAQGNILSIPLVDGIFDVVNSIETFEHVRREDIDILIKECHRVLRSGGLFLFSTPDGDKLHYQPKSPAEYQGWHYWHYTKQELQELLSSRFKIKVLKTVMDGSLFVCCEK